MMNYRTQGKAPRQPHLQPSQVVLAGEPRQASLAALPDVVAIFFGEDDLRTDAISADVESADLRRKVLGHMIIPAFVAAYGIGEPGCALRAAADEMVTMLPRRRSFMPGKKPLRLEKVAVRLPSTECRQPSSSMPSSGPGVVELPPALATRISTGPN